LDRVEYSVERDVGGFDQEVGRKLRVREQLERFAAGEPLANVMDGEY